MTEEELSRLEQWFQGYCRTFATPDAEDQGNFTLKETHTYEVCAIITRIARDLSLDRNQVLLAGAVALFHDVGRFSQYQRFKTFKDNLSVNHAALGASVLLEKCVLDSLTKTERELVVRVVTLHNVFSLPENLDNDSLLFLKMVRDADKLDIMRVMIEHCRRPEEHRSIIVALGLPDAPTYSPDVLSALAAQQMVKMTSLKTLNDFKLLQLAWVYDLHFTTSFRIAQERDYVDIIAATLPDADEVRIAVQQVCAYVDFKS